MGLQFIIGRARSGKTRYCVDRIVQRERADPLGFPIFYVVPKQATFSAQRRLALNAGLDGFCRVHVTTFERLADLIISECGGDAIPEVTPRGRRIVIAHLLRALGPKLRVYQQSSGRSGLADELDATFGELEAHGHDAQTLAGLIERLSADHPHPSPEVRLLIDKLHDVRQLYDAYQAWLADDRVDPHRRLQQVLELIASCQSIQDADVFIDGHLDFNDFQRKLICALARHARSVQVTLLMDPESPILSNANANVADHALFARTERAYRRLIGVLHQQKIVAQTPELLRRPETSSSSLDFIESNLFNTVAPPLPVEKDDAAIGCFSLPTRRDEVSFAASTIAGWMRDDGLRPRQIAVLCRNLSDWHDLIEAEFQERAIPFFTDRRRTASHHPLLQILSAMLSAALDGFGHESMMTLAKSGLCGINLPAADALENYVLRHAIRGTGWASEQPWTFDRRRVDEDEKSSEPDPEELHPDFADTLRRKLVDPIVKLAGSLGTAKKPRTIRQMTAALYEAIVAYGADRSLAERVEDAEAKGRLELAAEHEQVWSALVELLDELVDLLGDEKLPPDQFGMTIATALGEFDLAITPPTADQVIVGDFERSRFEHFDAVILLGWNEGEFPRVASEATVLGDEERRLLGVDEDQFALEPGTHRRLLDESLLAYIALTRARKRLCVTRRLADDDGRLVNPSIYLRELHQLVPGAATRGGDASERISYTSRRLVTDLAAWARAGAPAGHASEALYHGVVTAPCDHPTRQIAEIAWPALAYNNKATLSPPTVDALFQGLLETSVSRIESFVECPYKHFARSVLGLKLRPEPEITPLDMGSLMHRVFERLVTEQIQARQTWHPKHCPNTKKVVSTVAEAGEELRGELMMATARNRYVLHTISDAVGRVISWQHEIGEGGEFIPAGAEVVFGDLGLPAEEQGVILDALELTTPSGRVVRLRGKVDRVDICPTGQRQPVAVFDYKTSQEQLNLGAVYHGLALQLLAYLLVLDANGHKLSGNPLSPVAAFYVRLLRAIESINHPDEGPTPPKLRGVIHVDFVNRVSGTAAQSLATGITQKGEFKKDRSGDAVKAEEFSALLNHVRRKIATVADRIMGGEITVNPYLMDGLTPCTSCDYRPLCRFDPTINKYVRIEKLRRVDALSRIIGEGDKK